MRYPIALLACLAPFLAASLFTSNAVAQTLSVTPSEAVVEGDTIAIQLSGLAPSATVKLVAMRQDTTQGQPVLFRSEAVFKADATGQVDVATAKPVSGSYQRPDLRGLFWSMVPASGPAPAALGARQVLLQAWVDDKPVANATVQFLAYSPQVKAEPVPEFAGAVLASLGGTAKRPVVIVLGGSEGGAAAVRDSAMRLASRGFAAMSLPYFSPAAWGQAEREVPALPQSFVDIPVDRLEAARDWLQKRSDVDASRIGVLGISKEATFLRDKKPKPGEKVEYLWWEGRVNRVVKFTATAKPVIELVVQPGQKARKLIPVVSEMDTGTDFKLPSVTAYCDPETYQLVMMTKTG